MDQNSAQANNPAATQPSSLGPVEGTSQHTPASSSQSAQGNLSGGNTVVSQPQESVMSPMPTSSIVGESVSSVAQQPNNISLSTQLPPSVGGVSKEHAPISQIITESIKPTEQEPVLAPELKEAGIESIAQTDNVQIPTEVNVAGVEPVKTAVPVSISPSSSVALSMTEEEVASNIKTNPPNSSVRWLATEIQKHYLRIKGMFVKENVK